MKKSFLHGLLAAALLLTWGTTGCASHDAVPERSAPTNVAIRSEVESTPTGDLVLIQTVHIGASIDDVWSAYTTVEGWTAWASPHAEIDLRIGGTIRTHYGEDAAVGDPGTNTVHIVSYVPKRLLTLHADLSDNWPEVMKTDADRLSNVILFDDLGARGTRIRSYGIGYRDTAEYRQLMDFFLPANEGLFQVLIDVLEE